MYAGGTFAAAGPSGARVAKWEGSTWTPLGPSLEPNGAIYSLTVLGTNLYAGGRFTNAVVKWNGTNWVTVGSGFSGGSGVTTVYGLAATSVGNLYASGIFTMAGTTVVNNAACWDGLGWSALDDSQGPNQVVNAILINSSGLYAAGRFTTIGSVAANHIALWDGSRWRTVGPVGQGPDIHGKAGR